MKRVLVLLSLALLFACQSSPKTTAADSSGAQTYVRREIVPLYPEKADTQSMLLSFSLAKTGGDGSLQQCVGAALYGGKSMEEYTGAIIASYKKMYAETKADLPDDMPFAAMTWEYTETIEIIGGSDNSALPPRFSKVLQLCRTREYYTGGAHPMHEKRYFVFDEASAKQLALADIAPEAGLAALNAAAEASLRKDAGLAPNAPLTAAGFFDGHVTLPDNFYLTAEGIRFHWDPYQAAPYAKGFIEATAAYTEL